MNAEDPSTSQDAEIESQLRQQASEMDNGGNPENSGPDGDGEVQLDATTPAKDTTPEKTAKDAGTDPASIKPEDGRQQPTTPEKPQTAYEKARKEAERQQHVLANFQAEKEKFRAEREEFYRKQAEAAAQRTTQQQTPPRENARVGDAYSPAELDDAAARFEEAGKYEQARLARDEAQYARQRMAQGNRPVAQADSRAVGQPEGPELQAKFMAEWKANFAAAEKEMPELSDRQSELYKATAQVIQTYPYFSSSPKGAAEAAQLAKLQIEARSVPVLRTEIQTLKTEIDKLRRATSPGSGGAESRGSPKSFEQMSTADQEALIGKLAAEEDSRATA